MKGARAVKYIQPEIEWIRFENSDILTDSGDPEMDPMPLSQGDFSE